MFMETIGDILRRCLKCTTVEEAVVFLKEYEEHVGDKDLAWKNLGYVFGYLDNEERERMYQLFPVNHPFFGPGFGRGKDPTPQEAFDAGKKMGEYQRRKSA